MACNRSIDRVLLCCKRVGDTHSRHRRDQFNHSGWRHFSHSATSNSDRRSNLLVHKISPAHPGAIKSSGAMLPVAALAVTLPQEHLRQSVGGGSRRAANTFFADRQFTPPSRRASAPAGVTRKGLWCCLNTSTSQVPPLTHSVVSMHACQVASPIRPQLTRPSARCTFFFTMLRCCTRAAPNYTFQSHPCACLLGIFILPQALVTAPYAARLPLKAWEQY